MNFEFGENVNRVHNLDAKGRQIFRSGEFKQMLIDAGLSEEKAERCMEDLLIGLKSMESIENAPEGMLQDQQRLDYWRNLIRSLTAHYPAEQRKKLFSMMAQMTKHMMGKELTNEERTCFEQAPEEDQLEELIKIIEDGAVNYVLPEFVEKMKQEENSDEEMDATWQVNAEELSAASALTYPEIQDASIAVGAVSSAAASMEDVLEGAAIFALVVAGATLVAIAFAVSSEALAAGLASFFLDGFSAGRILAEAKAAVKLMADVYVKGLKCAGGVGILGTILGVLSIICGKFSNNNVNVKFAAPVNTELSSGMDDNTDIADAYDEDIDEDDNLDA